MNRPARLTVCLWQVGLLLCLLSHVWSDGGLQGMGANFYGQLGDGSTTSRDTPVQVLASGVQATAAGENHSLFIMTDGSLWAMGDNTFGQLGDGSTTGRTTPVKVLDSGVQAVAAGSYHSLFIKNDGSLWAMGNNGNGRLGDGTTTHRSSPVQVLASGVRAVAAGSVHSLFIKTDDSLWAMGNNGSGQLGDGSTTHRSSPVQVLTSVAAAAGGGSHTLIVKTDGALWAVGGNSFGQLGDGSTTIRTSPVQVLASGVAAVAAGISHSLVLKDDNSLHAMGYNFYGQLGDASTTNRNTPVQVLASGVVAVAAGHQFSLFIKADESLWGMGYNAFGQLGDDSATNRSSPVQAQTSTVLAAAAGGTHSLFIKAAASLPAVTILASDAEAGEPANHGRFTLSRSGPTTASLTVNLSVSGTASAGSDYSALPASVVFATGAATATVAVTVTNDSAEESAETVILTVAPGTGYTVGTPSAATVTINDDDMVSSGAITGVTPSQTALGATLIITGHGFTAKSVSAKLEQAVFSTKKPKSYSLSLVKGSLTDTAVRFIAKTGKVGVYHLKLFRRGVKLPYTLTNAVTLAAPAVSTVTPETSARNATVTLNGTFFGAKKGTVTLQLGKKKTRVKVTAWSDTSISFLVPKKQKAGSYTVSVKNQLGTVVAAQTLTIVE